jgi:hypothetical protein
MLDSESQGRFGLTDAHRRQADQQVAFDDHALVTEPQQPAAVPTLALRVKHAAASLGLSESAFRRDVLPNVRSVKVGSGGSTSTDAWQTRTR